MSASSAAELIDGIYLRHTGSGHLRFALPAQLCTAEAAGRIERGLVLREGVYRARVFRQNGKLSVRFREEAVSAGDVSKHLVEVVDSLPPEALIEPVAEAKAPRERSLSPALAVLLKKALAQAQARQAASANPGNPGSAGAAGFFIDKATEQKAMTVLNEIVLFYLIRLHWDIIANRLIKKPFANIGPWSALTYLLFLYVRHKKGS